MRKKTFLSSLLLAALLLPPGCSHSADPIPWPDEVVVEGDFIKLDRNLVTLDPMAYETVDVKVRSSQDWTLEGNCSWATPNATKGRNFGLLTFNVKANDAFEPRSAEFTFTCASQSTKLTINQKANDVLTQDADGTYELQTLKDWKEFVGIVNKELQKANDDGVPAPVINARMEDDIDLGTEQSMIATAASQLDFGYNGTFDGQGHTLTINYQYNGDGGEIPVALFGTTANATVKNLRIAGTVTSTEARSCAFAAFIKGGTSNFIKCTSSIVLTNNGRAGTWHDGGLFCGRVSNGAVANFSDCLCDGQLIASTDANEYGGFVGWKQGSGTVNMENCLFAPAKLEVTTADCSTFVGGGINSESNLWYTMTLGNAQGSDGSGKSAAELVVLLNAGRADGPWTVSDGKAVLSF